MRLICLSAESADLCARLGAWAEVVAVSAYADQTGLDPRPVVSGFSSGDAARIAAYRPDLVITFSDVQADLTTDLIRAGWTVLATNPRSLADIVATIRLVGGAIGYGTAAGQLADNFTRELDALRRNAFPRPRVYFEEWPEPLISGIGWVGELIEHCGGDDVFATRRGPASRDRVVATEEILAAQPDLILASWCGKRVDLDAIRTRPGFDTLPAVRRGAVYALDSSDFLQPGLRLLHGARTLRKIFDAWDPPSA